MRAGPAIRPLRDLALGALIAFSSASGAQIERVSVADDELQANADSYQAAVSDDGSVVAFRSNADNLVAGDTNDWTDVFVRDIAAGTTVRASIQPDGSETPAYSMAPSISDDGTVVAFESRGAASGVTLTAVYDATAGTVEHRVLGTVNGNPTLPGRARLRPAVSGNGRLLAFHSKDSLQDAYPASIRPADDDFNGTFDVFVLDLDTVPAPPLDRVSRDSSGQGARAESAAATLSDDGNVVAFHSYSDDLVADDLNESEDVFVRFRDTGVTLLVSATPSGGLSDGDSLRPFVSGNGDFVAFRSLASDLVADDSNGHWDIFVRDLEAGITQRVSIGSDATESNHDSFEASLSDDGRFVAFRSMAGNLVAGDDNERADVFVHDRDTSKTALVSTGSSGSADGHSARPAISGNGEWIVFESDATNLVDNDSNASRDVFRARNPLFDSAGGTQP